MEFDSEAKTLRLLEHDEDVAAELLKRETAAKLDMHIELPKCIEVLEVFEKAKLAYCWDGKNFPQWMLAQLPTGLKKIILAEVKHVKCKHAACGYRVDVER